MEYTTIDIEPLEVESDKKSISKVTNAVTTVGDYLSSPKTILLFSAIYLTGYISFIGADGGFTSQFLQFGPGSTSFIGIALDTWPKVILMYFVSFLSSLMNTYYLYAMTNNLHSYIWNRAVPEVPFSRRWTYIVILAEPFIMQILSITQFFTNLTMQLQFILPQFLGSIIIEIPFTIQRLQEKTYLSD
jgi:hypothetical protein